jgi:DNA polymerase-1
MTAEVLKMKLVLIDGHSILNRAFYGVPDLTNSENIHTNAVYGFLNIMLKILEEEKPDYLTVAFDVKAPTFRHEMYQEYKGTRKPMPEELHQQVPIIKAVLGAMEIKIVEAAGYEADDLIGTLSRMGEAAGMDVVIVSGDRDLLQLASKKTKIRIPKTLKGTTEVIDYYEQDVLEAYQVTPAEFIDLKALMGDTSDNIPGAPGIGEKTATAIITRYHSVEEAYAHVEEITPTKAKNSLRENIELVRLSRRLAEINRNVPISYDFKEARLGKLYTAEAYELFKRYEFKSLLKKFDSDLTSDEITSLQESFRLLEDFSEIDDFFEKAEAQKQDGGIGIELIADAKAVYGAAVAVKSETAYIPVGYFVTQAYLLERLGKLCAAQGKTVFINLKDKLSYLKLEYSEDVADLAIYAYLLNPLKDTYDYDDLARDFLKLQPLSRSELIGKVSLLEASEKQAGQLMKAACMCAYVCRNAYEAMRKQLKEQKMEMLCDSIEMPLLFVLYDMEQEGMRVNREDLKEYGDRLAVRIGELEKEIYQDAGCEFNINSPKQLGDVLFEQLKLPGGKKTKTGYSTSAEVLEKLRTEHPVIEKILEYRQLAKLKSTYADGMAGFIQQDGRIHSKFNQTITATGRISSTEPNLQNIPIRMELGRQIRKVFIPRDGYVFLDADYSQIELRILAHMSGDENLIQAYHTNEDIHRITASQVFHVPFEEVTPELRRNAKAVNFGIVYGISSFGLSQDLSISKKEAAQYIERYFETYPGIKTYLDNLVRDAKEKGYAVTMYGRRRPVPELFSSNFMQRSFGERIAMNSPIQGTAADIIKIAMVRVHGALKKRNLKSKLILQVHDELLIETAKDEIGQVKEILEREMHDAAQLRVPLEIDMHSGTNWFEAK